MILSSSLMFSRSILLVLVTLLFHSKDALVAGKIVGSRPKEYVPTKILQYGCIPFKDFQCPPVMECLVDLNYAYWGQCYCKNSFFKRFKPPQDTGSELHRPGRQDCINYGSINIFATLLMGSVFIGQVLLEMSIVLMIYRVWKHGGLKPNATTYAMILLAFVNAFVLFVTLDFTLNRAGWDPHYKFHDHVFQQTQIGITLTNTWMVTESVCTWFDLWKRSISMSKKTSVVTVILRWCIRVYGLAISIIFALTSFSVIKSSKGKYLTSKIVQANIWTVSCITVIFGFLIRRVLCKNMKDTSNPNWKAANAIQTTSLTSALCMLLFQGAYKMSLVYGLYASGPIAVWEVDVFAEQVCYLVHYRCWFDYLCYCQRRYLESYESDRVSNYFGFSTIGRKQSSAMMSSAAASSMQMMSSASSVASSSTVEVDQPAVEKASVA